ncbi:MAG: SDR family NAD(P)-dependent oxidoreductase [Alphaproteobacteria bacterium]|nr:SDR family NAD(P)-dependent oxidoreductase [Alphaproteobacteria bacterium]
MAETSRVAVVTGGASGIGYAIARHLAGEGMSVVAADRDGGACSAASAAGDETGRLRFVEADIGSEDGARHAIDSAVETFGRLDLLCNNAAVHPLELIEDHDPGTWRETFRVNVEGTMLCSQRALPYMKQHGRGAIVNIGSISGLSPYATGGAYAASKAAVAMLTKVLAVEAGPYGITVNCIAPGSIRHRPGSASEEQSPPENIPIGRRGTTADVAHMVSYLASEAAGYLTGAVIVLDGGATAGRTRR